MPTPSPQQSVWKEKIVTIASASQNIAMVVKELIKNSGWRVSNHAGYLDAALAEIQHSYANILIVDESTDLTGPEAVRALVSHPIGRLTPCLILLSDWSRLDMPYYEKILGVVPVLKPLTPSKFQPAFDSLIKKWESPLFTVARKCAHAMTKGEYATVVPVLSKLAAVPETELYASQALSQILVSDKKWKDAETILLQTSKRSPRNLGLLLALSQFYMAASMPRHSLRFIERLKSACGGTTLFAFDACLAALALDKVDVALEHLQEWNFHHPGCEHVISQVARLLYAEGRGHEIEELLHTNKALVKRLSEQWEKMENLQQTA